MTKATLAQARHWLLQLATGQPEFNGKQPKETELVIRPLAASLIKTYEADAFCEGSRESVSSTLKWFREADIRERLDTWCSLNIRDAMALPIEAETAAVTRPAKFWLAMWYRASSDGAADKALELIQSQSAEAFEYLVRFEARAASCAVWRGWHVPRSDADMAAEWDDEAAIRAMVHKVVALRGSDDRLRVQVAKVAFDALVQTIKVRAPQHSEAFLDELRWIAEGSPSDSPVQAVAPVPDVIALPEILFGD